MSMWHVVQQECSIEFSTMPDPKERQASNAGLEWWDDGKPAGNGLRGKLMMIDFENCQYGHGHRCLHCIQNWVVLHDGCCWDNIPLDSIPLFNSIMSKIFRMLHFELIIHGGQEHQVGEPLRLLGSLVEAMLHAGKKIPDPESNWLVYHHKCNTSIILTIDIDSQSVQSFCQLSVSASGTCNLRSITRAGSTQTTTTTSRLMLISLPLSDLKLHHRIWQVA